MTFTRVTDRFTVLTNDNRRIKVVEYTEYYVAKTFGQPDQISEGMKQFRTVDGDAVNQKGDDTYELVFDGRLARAPSKFRQRR